MGFPAWIEKHIDVGRFTFLEVNSDDREYFKLILKYGTEHCVSSFVPLMAKEEMEDGEEKSIAKLQLGHGIHEGSWQGKRLLIARFTVGDPVGLMYNVDQQDRIVVFLEGYNQQDALQEYLQELLDRERSEPPKNKFRVYRWNVCNHYWFLESLQKARALDSVVLPKKLHGDITSDLEQFLDQSTKEWYNKHGIPYKRSYIFYGPPGTGKTSFIQALAGVYGRHVCFLQPNDAKFTDDMLKSCLQKAPPKSIIVLEDIDALFNNRHSMNRSCPLTFTGLLNGLDGIGNAVGQVFVLSTNHLERLDPALIRSGRVDRKFEFGYCSDEALAKMFERFYPETELCDEFVEAVRSKCSNVTAADLQQAFIANMTKPDTDCIHYMKHEFELGQDLEKEFEEIDRRLKRERKIADLKRQKQEEEELKKLKEEVEGKKEDAEEKKEDIADEEKKDEELASSGDEKPTSPKAEEAA